MGQTHLNRLKPNTLYGSKTQINKFSTKQSLKVQIEKIYNTIYGPSPVQRNRAQFKHHFLSPNPQATTIKPQLPPRDHQTPASTTTTTTNPLDSRTISTRVRPQSFVATSLRCQKPVNSLRSRRFDHYKRTDTLADQDQHHRRGTTQ